MEHVGEFDIDGEDSKYVFIDNLTDCIYLAEDAPVGTHSFTVTANNDLLYHDGVNLVPVEIDEQEMIRNLEEKGYTVVLTEK